MLSRCAAFFTQWSLRWVPDAFVVAVLLTILTAGSVWIATPTSPTQIVQFWGDGFWILLKFSMQMCLIMMTGYIVAVSNPVRKALDSLSELAKTSRSAVIITALVAMLLCTLNWGLGLVTSALFVRSIAQSMERRNIQLDYRLLVACAYLGMAATWHAGFSGSSLLLMATPHHFLQNDYGLISTENTIFHPFNLCLLVIVIATLTLLAWRMHPTGKPKNYLPMPHSNEDLNSPTQSDTPSPSRKTPASLMEHSWILSGVMGIFGAIWLGKYFSANGFNLTLDVVNLLFLTLGILLHRTPHSFLQAAADGGKFIWGVVIQFPLYAGIFGMVKYSGLQDVVAAFIVEWATPNSFALLNYWYSGLLNYFVPSGGGQWAIQAPYIMKAGADLGVPPALTVLSYAWGDMMTDAIQPFWAIPLLGITRLGFKDIMGYLIVFFAVYATLVSVAFGIAPFLNLF